MELPDKKYSVIYLDPPWDYKGQKAHNGSTTTGGAASHYNVLTLNELKALDIPSISEKNCCMFMWVGSPLLDQAIELGKAWGFKFKTVGFVWHKEALVPGYYTMSSCELCLVFTRGTIPKNRGTRNERQFLSEKRSRRHSEKPHEIRERINRMFPSEHHLKIELFARHTTSDWDVWGNDPNLDR